MTRAPFVMPKAQQAFARQTEVYDTTIGWRFVNPVLKTQYGVDSMPETAENVAEDFHVSREDQDAFALRSQQRAGAAQQSGRLALEITPVTLPRRRGDPVIVETDEHPRPETTADDLARLKPFVREGGTITAANASGVNDGAAALIIASEAAIKQHGLTPIARVLGGASIGVAPRVMGIGPAPASEKLMARLGLTQSNFDVIELNEAFASQGLATLRRLGIADDDPRVNRNGGAIALGHPLGMSGARITGSAALDLRSGQKAVAMMCIGVGQGIAIAIEAAG
jgi:acetyl-CoA acetyltransferase family protein